MMATRSGAGYREGSEPRSPLPVGADGVQENPQLEGDARHPTPSTGDGQRGPGQDTLQGPAPPRDTDLVTAARGPPQRLDSETENLSSGSPAAAAAAGSPGTEGARAISNHTSPFHQDGALGARPKQPASSNLPLAVGAHAEAVYSGIPDLTSSLQLHARAYSDGTGHSSQAGPSPPQAAPQLHARACTDGPGHSSQAGPSPPPAASQLPATAYAYADGPGHGQSRHGPALLLPVSQPPSTVGNAGPGGDHVTGTGIRLADGLGRLGQSENDPSTLHPRQLLQHRRLHPNNDRLDGCIIGRQTNSGVPSSSIPDLYANMRSNSTSTPFPHSTTQVGGVGVGGGCRGSLKISTTK